MRQTGVFFSVRHRACGSRALGCPGSRDMLESRATSTAPVLSDQHSLRWRSWLIVLCVLLALAIIDEVRTSRLQSSVLTRYAARLTYDIGTGPSSRIVFPSSGPHDQELGYSRLPEFTRR